MKSFFARIRGFTFNNNILYNIVSSFLSVFSLILINFIVTRFFLYDIGIISITYKSISTSILVFFNLFVVSLTSMSARFISVSFYSGDYHKANSYYSSLIIGVMLLGVFLSILFGIILIYIYYFIYDFDVFLMFLFSFSSFLIPFLFFPFFIFPYLNNKLFIKSNFILIFEISKNVILVAFLLLFETKIYSIALSNFIAVIFLYPTLYFLNKKADLLKYNLKLFNLNFLTELFSSGIWVSLSELVIFIQTQIDILLSAILLGPVFTGFYALAKIIPKVINQIFSSLNFLFTPFLFKNVSINNNSIDKNPSIFTIIFLIYSSLIGPNLIVIIIFYPFIFNFWLPGILNFELQIISTLFLITPILFSPFNLIFQYFVAKNYVKENAISLLYSSLIFLFILFVLFFILRLGSISFAISAIFSSNMRYIFFIFPFFSKISKFKLKKVYSIFFFNIITMSIIFVLLKFLSNQINDLSLLSFIFILILFSILAMTISGFFNFIFYKFYSKNSI